MTHDDYLMITQHCLKRMDDIGQQAGATGSTQQRRELEAARAELLGFLQDLNGGRIAGLVDEGAAK